MMPFFDQAATVVTHGLRFLREYGFWIVLAASALFYTKQGLFERLT